MRARLAAQLFGDGIIGRYMWKCGKLFAKSPSGFHFLIGPKSRCSPRTRTGRSRLMRPIEWRLMTLDFDPKEVAARAIATGAWRLPAPVVKIARRQRRKYAEFAHLAPREYEIARRKKASRERRAAFKERGLTAHGRQFSRPEMAAQGIQMTATRADNRKRKPLRPRTLKAA